MITQKPGSLVWRKSSYSSGNGDCVEVAATSVGVLLRDSKNPGGPILAVGTGQWREFVGHLSPSRSPM